MEKRGVDYEGPVSVRDLDVPPFSAAGVRLAGHEERLTEAVTEYVGEMLSPLGVQVTSKRPVEGDYSVIYVGGTDQAFQAYGSFFGLAEGVDVGNVDKSDLGLVFSNALAAAAVSPAEFVQSVAHVAAHEAGHLLGLGHGEGGPLGRLMLARRSEAAGPLADVAHESAWETPAHQYIIADAIELYMDQFSGSELAQYSFKLVQGTRDQDCYCDDHPFVVSVKKSLFYTTYSAGEITQHHFCEGGDGLELSDGLLHYRSAYTDASDIFFKGRSEGTYTFTPVVQRYGYDQVLAYYYLGHVAHLLADMTTPVHVHNDMHPGSDWDSEDGDNYELWVGNWYGKNLLYRDRYLEAADPDWHKREIGGVTSWQPYHQGGTFEQVFRLTTDYTDDYPSDDYWGDKPDGISPDYNADFVRPGRHRPLEIWSHELTLNECEIVAADLIPWAIERTAVLFRYFYSVVDTTPPILHAIDLPPARIGSTGLPCFDGSFKVTGWAEDPESGVDKMGYQYLVRRYDENQGRWEPTWTEIPQGEETQWVNLRPGYYKMVLTAENGGGLRSPISDSPVVVFQVDASGPQVDSVSITDDADYDLFDPKPSTDGPTPLVHALDIELIDQPARWPIDLYPAANEELATQPGNIQLVGDHVGIIPIEWIEFVNHTLPDDVGRSTVRLHFSEPLPDDRFTLTLSDHITDDYGNALDGESNAAEPQAQPSLPSGDGNPGGDFDARFTVDSRAEIGVWSAGSVYVDTNGNFLFDPQSGDFTNRDIVYMLGSTSDEVLAGNFLAPDVQGPADGFDKLAIYSRVGQEYRWQVDTDNDGVPDVITSQGVDAAFNGLPLAGNFDGDAQNGDEIGLFNGSTWFFDTDHDFVAETAASSAETGYPITGDFDADGLEDLGMWRDDHFFLSLSKQGGGVAAALGGSVNVTADFEFGFIGVRERPVAADMDGDGIDDLGLWVPDRSGATLQENGEWYFLVSDGRSITQRIVPVSLLDPEGAQTVHFTPIPFGKDLYAQFGDEFGMPVVGNFDPPVSGRSEPPALALVSLTGTPGDDTFEFRPGATPATWIVTLNGASQTIAAAEITVTFDGQGGRDVVALAGTGADDVAKLWPDHGVLSSDAYSVTVSGVEAITAFSNGGSDVAYLYGDPGSQDVFKAWPDRATLSGKGYSNEVKSFRYAHGYGQSGTGDVAYLFDNPATADTFQAWPDVARLYGPGFYNRVKSFDYVHGYATSDGGDVACLYDRSDTQDTFQAWPDVARLYGKGFYNRVKSFDYVHAYATPGCDDVAYLYDSPDTQDRFEGYPTMARLFGPGFYNRVKSFRYVHGYATPGGEDAAHLYDSGGNDVFEAWPDMARLYGPGFYNRVKSFRYVNGHATSGGYDRARLHDSTLEASPDRLEAQDDWAGLSNDLLGYAYLAKGFEQVDADSSDSSDQLSIDPHGVDFLLLINGEEW